MQYCSTPHCKTIVQKGHCAEHQQARNTAHRHSLHPGYNTARWQRLRAEHRAQHPFCVRCPQRSVLADVVDHIVPAWAAPERFFDGTNLQSLCFRCNATKAHEDAKAYASSERRELTPPLREPVIA